MDSCVRQRLDHFEEIGWARTAERRDGVQLVFRHLPRNAERAENRFGDFRASRICLRPKGEATGSLANHQRRVRHDADDFLRVEPGGQLRERDACADGDDKGLDCRGSQI